MSGQEKRQHARMEAPYQYFLNLGGKSRNGLVRDVSPYGAGIYSDAALAPGEVIELAIFIPGSGLRVEAKGEVIYCVDNPDRAKQPANHIIGLRFTEGTLEDLSLVSPLKRASRHTPSHTITINAGAAECYKRLCNYERYPEWASGVEAARVLERYPDGRGLRVEFIHNFFFRKVRYLLDYVYDDANKVLSWVNAGGDEDIMTISGNYTFTEKAPGLTSARYELYITLSIVPSKQLVRYVTNILMLKEMKNFKAFVEKNAGK